MRILITGTSVTIDYLADQMMDVVGLQVYMNYKDFPVGDPMKSEGTIQKIEKLFSINLDNLIPLNQGLSDTIQYIRNAK